MTSAPHDPAEPEIPSNTLSIIGIVSGVLAAIVPILFGPPGLILGGLARRRHERLANVALIVSTVGILVGLTLGVIVVLRARS